MINFNSNKPIKTPIHLELNDAILTVKTDFFCFNILQIYFGLFIQIF